MSDGQLKPPQARASHPSNEILAFVKQTNRDMEMVISDFVEKTRAKDEKGKQLINTIRYAINALDSLDASSSTPKKSQLVRKVYPKPSRKSDHRPKEFQCNVCPKEYGEFFRLKKHQRVHGFEKKYECRGCKKRMTDVAKRKTHELFCTKMTTHISKYRK